MHHTYTNVVGKDHDLGYGILRVSADQEWKPYHIIQPIVNVVLSMIFQFGIGNHGVTVKYSELPEKEKTKENLVTLIKEYWDKIEKNSARDYIIYPLLAGFGAPKVFLGNLLANLARNVWTHSIIFCGHFTENIETFPEEVLENETKSGWYMRQLKGSSNLEGSKLFYILTGHLSHQIEHHMFPDIPANRYEEMAPRVREICEKYGQHYNTGGFVQQFTQVWKRLFQYSIPNMQLV
jgi:linoleoyl-CoA desaturase